MNFEQKIKKINLDIEKIMNANINFNIKYRENVLANNIEKISTNSLKYLCSSFNLVEFKKIEDILVNKFSQIQNTIDTQINFWSQIFFVKENKIQAIPSIFRFMMVNSIYTMIDTYIFLYKWVKLLNEICNQKKCIIKEKSKIIKELVWEKNLINWYIEKVDDSFKLELIKVLNLRNNIIHTCNTFDNKNLIESQKSIFDINSTLYTIHLVGLYEKNNLNSLLQIKINTLKRIDKSDNNYNLSDGKIMIDLFEIWNSFILFFDSIFNKINKLLFDYH